MKSLSHVRLFETPWTIAHQAPLFMEFPRHKYQSGLPFPSPRYLPNKPRSPALQADSLPLSHQGHPYVCIHYTHTHTHTHTEIMYQFSSVAQLCLTPCNPMDCSTPGFPVHHQRLKLAQTQVHRVSDTIQSSHPLSSPSPLTFYLSQRQGLFQ